MLAIRISSLIARSRMMRVRRGLTHVVLALLLGALVTACSGGGGANSPSSAPPPSGGGTPPPATADFVTYKNDISRTGQNLAELVLTPANVNSSSFGLLRFLSTDGKVDAQPLYLSALTVQGATHNAVFVATENDTVYAFDADSGAVLWKASLLASGENASDAVYGCDQTQ